MSAMSPMKRVVLWLVALNACGVLAVSGHLLIGYGLVSFSVLTTFLFFVVPLIAVAVASYPLHRSIRRVTDDKRRTCWTLLLSAGPAVAGISGLGSFQFFIEDQVVSGWQWFVFIHIGYGGLLLLSVMTVHCSSALFSTQISHRYDQMLTWTDGIVKGLFVFWIPTFICFLASVWLFGFLYPVAVLATAVHFTLLYRAVVNVEAASESGNEPKPEVL